MLRASCLLCLALAPALVLAQDRAREGSQDGPLGGRTFQPPAGCEAFLTVQMTSCTVSHHFRCEADPEGWQRRVDMDEGGVAYFGAIDGEARWMESVHVLGEHAERLGTATDPASFTELTTTGRDSFDFETLSDEIGSSRYAGEDSLPGETVTIDGVTLDRTEYRITAYDAAGNETWRSAGSEFVSREWRMFLSGTGTTSTPDGETWKKDDTPVEFVFPDEPGFLSVSPKHGCGAVMSRWEAPAAAVPGARG